MSKVVAANNEMKVEGHSCRFNMPAAVVSRKDSDGNEIPQGLPPGHLVPAYAVDEFPACPDNWMHGSAKASSYFLPIQEGRGMWLDFNSNRSHTHDVAVVVSVQGINSVTGQKTSAMRLEQYKTKCPIHDVEFQQDRFCPTCKYKWPAQNYLTTTSTPHGHFWLDGFRNAQGQVRQYVFSADEAKGVAAKKIGNDRVFAIGIAFYRSKNPKPVEETYLRSRGMTTTQSYGGAGGSALKSFSPIYTPQHWQKGTTSEPALYSSDNIKTLSEAEHKKARPQMYAAEANEGMMSCDAGGDMLGELDSLPIAFSDSALEQKLNSTFSLPRQTEKKTSSGIKLSDHQRSPYRKGNTDEEL